MTVKNNPLPLQGFDDRDSFALEPQYGTLFRNTRANRRRIVRSPGATLLAPPPMPATPNSAAIVQMEISSPTATGSQVYSHSLGVAPKAFIFQTSTVVSFTTPGGVRSGTIKQSYATMIGFSDGTTEGARSHASRDNQTAMEVWHSYGNFAILLIDQQGNDLLHASVTAMDASTFTLNWTTVDAANSYLISVVLIGGTGPSAKVVEWQPTGVAGNQSIATVGFLPQIVMHIVGNSSKATIQGAGTSLSFGVMSPRGQWSVDSHSIDLTNPSITKRGLRTDRCIAVLSGITGGLAFSDEYEYVSMDANGFTVNGVNPLSANQHVISLALAGLPGATAGAFLKTADSAPANEAVTGVGFKPSWVLLDTVDGIGTGAYFNTRRSHGSSDGTASFFWTEQDQNDVTPTNTSEAQNDTAVLLAMSASNEDKWNCKLQGFDTDGFTLNFPENNTQAVTVVYIALSAITGGASGAEVIRNYPEVWVGSSVALKNWVMLTNKSAYIYTPSDASTGIWTPTPEIYTGDIYRRFSWVNTQAIAAWSQGVDNIRQWDGVSFSDLITVGTNHAANALIAFADRIISIYPVEGANVFPTQIRWCVNGNVNDWLNAGSGRLEIIETSQDPLVTGFVLGERAYLAKQRELIELIWTGTTSPVFGTQPRVRGMGVLAPFSVGLAEQFAFWLGPDDIYMWDGSTLTPVGERVYNTIDSLIDYNNISVIQGAVYEPDDLYLLVVPPYLFVYDYRRDIWYQDDTSNFEAIGIFTVGTPLFTADIDHSEFEVIGDSFMQTIRMDQSLTNYLGAPIDSYWTSKDYTAEELARGGQGFHVTLWDLNSLREVRFQSNAGYIVEVGVSVDRGVTWQTTTTTVNATGVGVAWFQVPFSQIRFRFRRVGTDAYEIHGQWGIDTETAGYQLP